MKYFFALLLFVLTWQNIRAQSFIFNQLFRPSIRINTLYSHDFNFANKDRLHLGQANINCIIPIANKLAMKVDWKKLLTLRLRKASKLKVYQIFWNFRPRVNYLDLEYKNGTDCNPFQSKPHFTYGFSTGITGIHLIAKLLKKPKFLFYQLTVGMQEDIQSVQVSPVPTMTALIGFAHMRGLNVYWYYGFYFNYDNGQIIPAPFLGFQFKLGRKVWCNITLPVQLKFSFKLSKKFKIDIGGGISGFSTAFGYRNNNVIERHVLGVMRIRTGMTFNIKLGPQAILYLEGGAYPYQLPNFRWHNPTFTTPDLGVPVYGGLSLFYSFKKALLGSVIDGMIL